MEGSPQAGVKELVDTGDTHLNGFRNNPVDNRTRVQEVVVLNVFHKLPSQVNVRVLDKDQVYGSPAVDVLNDWQEEFLTDLWVTLAIFSYFEKHGDTVGIEVGEFSPS